jgi:hypothetical protein
MEIRIKTPTEFRDAHVTIEIRADQNEVPEISRRLTGPGVADLSAGELAAEVQRLEAERDAEKQRANDWAERAGKALALEAERDALLLKVEGYDLDRHTEKQRADENRGWAERTEALLVNAERELKGYQDSHVCTVECEPNKHTAFQGRKMLTELKGQLVRIQDKVWSPTLDTAIENRGNRRYVIPVEIRQELVDAVSAVRSIVGQP